MTSKITIWTYLLLFLLCGDLYAQQITVQTTLVNQNLEMFFISNLDIFGPKSAPKIFQVVITKPYPGPTEVRLDFSIRSSNYGNLLSAQTNPFWLEQTRTELSNRDLFSRNGMYSLQSPNITNAAKKLKDHILATGKLPNDSYVFKVEISEISGGSPNSDQFQVDITNPKKLDLIFPGMPVTRRRGDCQEIFTNLPQFRWESDMRRFRVIIAEARPGEDPESVLNQEPRFVGKFIINRRNMVNILPDDSPTSRGFRELPGTSFQYPASGEILTLRPGKIYYWRVVGIVTSSNGDFKMESEIYCFRIAKLDQMGGRKQQMQFILRNILGSDYEKLFGEGGELEEYRATRVLLNGESVTLGDLIQQMNKINSNYSGYRIE